ncbi:MAG: PorP/SprF family type IX secretion system membrane protein [Bacteroidaceae bacterium]|nr:PorP/SprF family type IX secretion system membrane protein [Bacteroidaceae bacterium]
MKRLLWIGMLLFSLGARAQFDAAFTNSWDLKSYFNPAAAGVDGLLNVKAVYNMQMVGFENAPKTMLITADMPLFFIGPNHGVGLGLYNDKAGVFNTQKIMLSYAYHMKLLGGLMSISARPALFVEKTDGSGLELNQPGDPAFSTSDAKGQALDLDIGLRYTYKKLWYTGVSVMHLMGQTISLGDEKKQEITVDPVFYVTGGYRYKFRYPRYALAMDAILRSDLTNWRGDITARLEYDGEKHKLYGGVMYSPMNSVGIMLGYNFHGVNIGYAYEVYTGGISVINGTHEIMIGYQTDLNLGKKGKNLHKSVRLL